LGRLAASGGAAAAVHDRALVHYDAKGAQVGSFELGKRGESVARFGDEWLVLIEKQKHLLRVSEAGEATAGGPFAAGKAAIDAFAVGRDDTVVLVRGETVELWSRHDKRQWAAKLGPSTDQLLVARDQVVVLGEDGALHFFSRERGERLGALRLASPEPCTEWRLVHVDGTVVVLALGDWLVWIDAATRKTVRRVRARAKVREMTADGEHVAVFVEDGFIQAFRATSGEPRGTFAAEDPEVSGLALGGAELFMLGTDGVRASDRRTLEAASPAASPVSSVTARGLLAIAGDRAGRVRVLENGPDGLREVAALTAAEPAPVNGGVVGLHVTKNDTVIAAGPRVLMRVPRPWKAPLPIALRGAPTAFAADDAYAFAGSQSGAVEVYDLAAGRHVTTYALSSDDRITALLRTQGASLVVGTGALDGRVLVVDIAEAKVVHRVTPHEEAFGVTCLAADGRGRIVASGGDDGSIALLDPNKGRVLARLRVNETPMSLAFEPSGRRLACVFADGTAAIVTFAQKSATVADLGVRGASHVAWADGLVFGFKDGHVEPGDRHTRPSERPAAARQ
jgi:hypothetical protein